MGTNVKQQKERLCEIIAKKITPEGEWINVSLFKGYITECEQFQDSREWVGYKDVRIISGENN